MAVAGILAPALGYALGLGEISTNSALNQPLDADIQLISAAGEVDKVTVKLAPNSVFNQAGITRSGFLDQLKFEPVSIDGAEVIKITSQVPIQEPFINFIIEVSWPKGKLLREYTVLLDPPVLGGAAASSAQQGAASAEADDGVPPFLAGTESEAFSVTDDAAGENKVASEGAGNDPVGSSVPQEPKEATSVESEADQAESFAVTDDAKGEAQGSSSGGISEIFVSMAGTSGEAPSVSSEAKEEIPETFSVASDAPAEADTNTVDAEESETFSVTDSEVADDQRSGSSEGFTDIFVTMPEIQSIAESATSSAEEAAPTNVSSKPSIAAGDKEYQVGSGDTLSVLARDSLPNKDVSVAQMMAAFLRENPGAFANGNINSLKAGYILRVPDESMAAQVSSEEAIRELDGHGGEVFAQYRSKMADAAVPQQASDGEADDAVASGSGQADEVTGENTDTQTEDKSELEILVPDGEGGGTAENQVADNGAAVEALEKEIALAKERLESKSVEATELQSRVTDLEGIVSAKERLIQLKEEELTGLQQQLSEGAAVQESKASDLKGTVAEKDLLIQQKEEELSALQQKLTEDVKAQESRVAELESVLAEREAELSDLQKKLSNDAVAQESKVTENEGFLVEKDSLIQQKETELAALQQKITEGAAAQESKVADFEGIVAEKDRLIQVKDAELAELQQKLSANDAAAEQSNDTQGGVVAANGEVESEIEAPPVGALEAEEIAETKGGGQAEQAENEIESATESPLAATEAEGEVEAQEVETQEPVVEGSAALAEVEQVSKDSAGNPNLLVGAGVGGLLLAMLGWLALRKKKPQEAPVVKGDIADATTSIKPVVGSDDSKPLYSDGHHVEVVEEYVDDGISDATMVVETQPEPFIEPSADVGGEEKVEVDESSISVEEEADIVAAMTAELAAGNLDLDLDVDEDLSSAGVVDGIEDEVLSESNVYLAYGLHDQAIELLKPAVDSNPDRTDYASKLLEAYHATGDKEAFVEVATGLHDKVGGDSNPVWQRAVVMGKDLVPDHALFVNADSGDLTLTAIQNQRAELMDVGENDEPLTEIEVDSKTLPLRREEGDFNVESNPAGEFELPDLDELSQSLQVDGNEVTVALKESQDELSQEILADLTGQLEGFKPDLDRVMDLDEDANLTLADVESELTSLTTGADEMSTKLDLAKAYIDMGDDEGAREALEEVISQGDETQSGEAKKLMDQIM
jgi:FimV-like protein